MYQGVTPQHLSILSSACSDRGSIEELERNSIIHTIEDAIKDGFIDNAQVRPSGRILSTTTSTSLPIDNRSSSFPGAFIALNDRNPVMSGIPSSIVYP